MDNPTFLLIGGYGQTGKCLAPLLLEKTNAQLVIAGRNLEKASAFSDLLNEKFGDRTRAVVCDVQDTEQLKEVIKSISLVLVASNTAKFAKNVAEAALSEGCDYLDVHYSTKHYDELSTLCEKIIKSRCCFITEAGFHPGLPSLLVRFAGSRLQNLETANISSAIRMKVLKNESMPESFYELMESFKYYKPMAFLKGKWRKIPFSWIWPYRLFRFPKPFGKKFCIPLHFKELDSMPEDFPSLKETGFYIASFNLVVDWLLSPFIMLFLFLFPKLALKPLSKLYFSVLKRFSSPPYGTVLRLEASGTYGGKLQCEEVTLFHEDEYQFTAIPVVAMLMQYLDGSARKPGLWMMGHLADPQRLLKDIREMGISIQTK